MRILHLADHKPLAMDKLYFYMLQSDCMLPKWLEDVETHVSKFLTTAMIDTMGIVHTVELSGSESDNDNDSYDDDNVSSNISNYSNSSDNSNDNFSNAMENVEGQNNAINNTNGNLDERRV
jgi:hypothetical protein